MASFYNARDLLPEFLVKKDGSIEQIGERVKFGEW
jgi:hypothetical protein